MSHTVTFIIAALLICTPLTAKADEIMETIEQAVTLYKQGDFTGAAGNLDYAAQLIRQQKGGRLESFLPDALSGWTADDAQSTAMGTAFLGGGVSAERNYQKDGDEARITITIITDSPMLQPMLMMFSNPMIAASSGAKLETLAGQRAIVNYTPSERRGEVNIVVANRILVTIKGDDVEKNDVAAYASAIDYQGVAKVE